MGKLRVQRLIRSLHNPALQHWDPKTPVEKEHEKTRHGTAELDMIRDDGKRTSHTKELDVQRDVDRKQARKDGRSCNLKSVSLL